MMLEYVTTEVLHDLEANFQSHKQHYIDLDKEWFDDYFKKTGGLRPSKIECEEFVLDMDKRDDNFYRSDLNNIKTVYTALKHIPISLASDPRLWIGLSFNQFWDYITTRRKEEIVNGSDKDIQNSFFFTYGVKRSAHIHYLSRLWWAGRISYDETRSDPFELTELLCRKGLAGTMILFSSSNLTANKNLALGILDSIKKRVDAGENLSRDTYFRDPTRYLNQMGAVTILDTLSREQTTKLIDKYFNRTYGEVNTI